MKFRFYIHDLNLDYHKFEEMKPACYSLLVLTLFYSIFNMLLLFGFAWLLFC